jgi:hypothetical protein
LLPEIVETCQADARFTAAATGNFPLAGGLRSDSCICSTTSARKIEDPVHIHCFGNVWGEVLQSNQPEDHPRFQEDQRAGAETPRHPNPVRLRVSFPDEPESDQRSQEPQAALKNGFDGETAGGAMDRLFAGNRTELVIRMKA